MARTPDGTCPAGHTLLQTASGGYYCPTCVALSGQPNPGNAGPPKKEEPEEPARVKNEPGTGNLNAEALERLAAFNGTDVATLVQYMTSGTIPMQDSAFAKNPNSEPERNVPGPGTAGPPAAQGSGSVWEQQQQQQQEAWAQQHLYVQQMQQMQQIQQLEYMQQQQLQRASQGGENPSKSRMVVTGFPDPGTPPTADDSSAVPAYPGQGGPGTFPGGNPTPWGGGNPGTAPEDTVILPRAKFEELMKKGKAGTPTSGRNSQWPPSTSKNGYRYYVPVKGIAKQEGIFAGAACMEKFFKPGTTWQNVGRYSVAGFFELQEAANHFYGNHQNHEVCSIHR